MYKVYRFDKDGKQFNGFAYSIKDVVYMVDVHDNTIQRVFERKGNDFILLGDVLYNVSKPTSGLRIINTLKKDNIFVSDYMYNMLLDLCGCKGLN